MGDFDCDLDFGSSKTWSELPEKKPVLICCPLIGLDRKNLPKRSCDLRQRDPTQKTCFGGCKVFTS